MSPKSSMPQTILVKASVFGRRPCTPTAAIVIVFLLGAPPVIAYPEFQEFTEKSGRPTNCAMCHVHPNGPVGDDDGQLGSLDQSAMARANKARAALEPGQDVDSPILNEFGNHIVKEIGMKRLLKLKSAPGGPAQLVELLGDKSDLDKDGIPDSIEYRDGTDPLNRFHGDPWRLFMHNLSAFRFDVALAVLAVLVTVYGLSNLVRGLHILSESAEQGD